MTFDLVLKHGTVIDPSHNLDAIRDVAIYQGKIAEIAPSIPATQAQKSVDILTHTYTSRPGGVIFTDTGVLPELHDAMERGIILNVAPAKSHFSFQLAKIGLDAGITPTVLSTDITNTNYQGPALFSLPVVMSKFLALGLKLEDVIAKTTVIPARILNEPQRGKLSLGNPADITILELLEGSFLFSDGMAGNTLVGSQLLEPRMTIKAGKIIPAQSRFRNYIPGEEVTLTKGA